MTTDEQAVAARKDRVEIATGVLMHQHGDDSRAARSTLEKMAFRSGKPLDGVADVVIGAAEMGCELECADEG
jgi:AmiR/NasT family two-component response regulator